MTETTPDSTADDPLIDHETHLTVEATIPVTESETVANGGDIYNSTRYTLSDRNEFRLSLRKNVKSDPDDPDTPDVLEIADELYSLLNGPDSFIYGMVPSEIRDEYDVRITGEEISVTVKIRGWEPVWLAARKRAAQKTRQSTIRQGYSVEKILLDWAGTTDHPYDRSEIEWEFDGLGDNARHLLMATIEHTRGGDIDASGLPIPVRETDQPSSLPYSLDRDEFHPDK